MDPSPNLYSVTSISAGGQEVPVHVYAPADGQVTGEPLIPVIFLPGAFCDASRYRWLGEGLARAHCLVLIPDPPLFTREGFPGRPVELKAPRISELLECIALVEGSGGRLAYDMPLAPTLVAGGHSAGGNVVMESVVAAEGILNPTNGLPPDFTTPPQLHGAFVLAAHLQATAMGMAIPWRDERRPLPRPDGLPVLLMSASGDAMATPEKVDATFRRLEPPVFLVSQAGGNHFGWTEGVGEQDRRDLDGPATIPPDVQQSRAVAYLAAFVRGVARGDALTGMATMAADAAAWGDRLESRI